MFKYTIDFVLIISAHSFTESEKVFDGLRLRTAGIATGLATNGTKVHVIFHGSSHTRFSKDGVEYSTWTTFDSFVSIVSKYRFVIFNYAALGLNRIVFNILLPNQILISDAIVPIELEESSRMEKNLAEDMDACKKLIQRSDVILISNERCRDYFVHFGSNLTYSIGNLVRNSDFLLLPFGLNTAESISPNGDRVSYPRDKLRLVWYGGVYPWFGISELESLISELDNDNSLIELTMIGVNNPLAMDSELKDITSRLLDRAARSINIRSISWLPYESRLAFLSQFDAAVFFNNVTQRETEYSWRQRYTDLILARLPLIVNALDPFSKLMVDNSMARLMSVKRILAANTDENLKSVLVQQIRQLQQDGNWDQITDHLSWRKTTEPLSRWIKMKSFEESSI